MTAGEVVTQAGSATTVSWLRAVRIEFALAGRAQRRFLLAALGVVVAAVLVVLVQALIGNWNEPPRDIGRDLGPAFMGTLLFTLLWSGEAWRDAPADARDWFWAQPIAQAQHELARVVAGLGWIAVAALTFIVLQFGIAVAYGQPVLLDRQTPLMWVDLVTGPLILFLLGSIAGLRSAHPLAWIIGGVFAVMTLPQILGAGPNSSIGHAQQWLVFAVIGPFNGPTGVVGRSSGWGGLWVAWALGTLAAVALTVVLVARIRRPS